MRRRHLFALVVAALAAASPGAASARPLVPGAAATVGEAGAFVEVGHRGSYGSHPRWRGYDHYRRHRGFSLRLGWGYPSYGYPWPPSPSVQYYPARPRMLVPTPMAPAPTYGASGAWTAQWYAYCASKYRSFDSRTGLYTTYSGHKRTCR